jgi:O-antigen ligase
MIRNYVTGNFDDSDIRVYSRSKALKILKDHPLWGVGPGMFGGIVASKYKSHIYELYNFDSGRKQYVESIGGIEQFWFQISAETGLLGTLCFINLIAVLLIYLYKLRGQAPFEELKGLFSALMMFMVCILLYTTGSGINIAPVLFTYFAFIGIGLGGLINR